MTTEILQGFYLGDLLVEPLNGTVTGRAGSVHLPPKAVEVLLCLASNPGEVISRDTLLTTAWNRGTGSQEALSHAVSEIRHALDDHSHDPVFIQTLPRRGYRLLVTPRLANEDASPVVRGVPDSAQATDVGLLEALNRRGVLETAIAYLVSGWLLIQVADIVFGQLHLPARLAPLVTMFVIAGFPIVLVLSWFLDWRAGRAVVTVRQSPSDQRRQRFSRTYLSVVGALAVAAVVVFVFDRIVGLPVVKTGAATAGITDSVQLPPVIENSFAVLPLRIVGGSDEAQVFANGLADDLINRLSRVPGLRVSSRRDSSSLPPDSGSAEVRQRLRVAMYLEGSVQMAGEHIRVTVHIIDSESGFQILSRAFDRMSEDYFEIRDEITNLTVGSVRAALPLDQVLAVLDTSDEPTLDVYLLYRRGVDAMHHAVSIDKINEALRWYDAALDVDPEYTAAHAGQCEAYVAAFDEVDDPVMIENAEAACARALQLNPNLVVVHTALGQLYHLTGRFDQAESYFKRALRIDPSSSESFTGLGEVYLAQNRPDTAEEYFRQAVGLHPGNWAAYNHLGTFLFRQGRYAEAAQEYEYVVALNRENMNAYSNLGVAYLLDGNFSSSLTAFERSLAIQPRRIAYSNLGLLYYYRGELEKSIAAHRQAIELEPNEYLAWSNLGDALSIAGKDDDALAAFRRARELATVKLHAVPNDRYTMMDLAWIDAMLDDHQSAASWIERVRELAPDDPYTYYYEGLVKYHTGDADAAIAALSEAVDKGYSPNLLAAEPRFASLKGDPRFLEVISRH